MHAAVPPEMPSSLTELNSSDPLLLKSYAPSPPRTHASVPPETRRELGISDGMIRLSVGIEDEADLVAEIKAALAAVPE